MCGAKLEPVLDALRHMKKLGIWVEVTTLLIPRANDDPAELRELAGFIVRELGSETPWHVSRFHPDYRELDLPPTPLATLTPVVTATWTPAPVTATYTFTPPAPTRPLRETQPRETQPPPTKPPTPPR